jgi:hypothetical protein
MCKKLELADVFSEFSSQVPRARFTVSALLIYSSLHNSLGIVEKLKALESRTYVLEP